MRFLLAALPLLFLAGACSGSSSDRYADATATADIKTQTAEANLEAEALQVYDDMMAAVVQSAQITGALVVLRPIVEGSIAPDDADSRQLGILLEFCTKWAPASSSLWPPEYRAIVVPTSTACGPVKSFTKTYPDYNNVQALTEVLQLVYKAGWDKNLVTAHKAIPDRSKAQVLRAIRDRQ